MLPSDPPRHFVELPRGPAAYTDEGTGPAIVALHGLPGSARDFRWLAPRVGARMIRIDQPGFGETPVRTEPDPSPNGRARFTLAVVRALGLDRPLLLGHSMGGIVACAACELDPAAFSGLALISSPGLRPHIGLRRVPVRPLDWLLKRPRLGPSLAPLLRRAFAAGGFRGYPDRELYRTIRCVAETSIAKHAARVPRLKLPTLVAWCDDDPLIEAEIAHDLAAACPSGPRLHFATGGHNPQKSHAEALGAALTAWLAAGRNLAFPT